MEEKQELVEEVEKAVEEVEKETSEAQKVEKVESEQAMEESEGLELEKVEKTDGKYYTLFIPDKDLKHPQVKHAMENLIALRINLHRAEPYHTVSEAEAEILPPMSQFAAIAKYKGQGKFKGEIGKFNSRRIVLVK